jgi:hypothetical protein
VLFGSLTFTFISSYLHSRNWLPSFQRIFARSTFSDGVELEVFQ